MLLNKMIIYILPSWYPTSALPNFGSFVKEQVELLAKLHPELTFIVGIRSDYDLILKITRPFHILYHFFTNSFKCIKVNRIRENFIEISNPAFSFKNFPKIFTVKQRNIALHKLNVKYCKNNFGEIRLIHAHVINPGGGIALDIAKQLQIPFLVSEHRKDMIQQLIIEKGSEYEEFIRVVIEADEIISVSKDQAQFINSYCDRLPLVIPNFIDENVFIPKEPDNDGGVFVFSTLAGLTEGKGLDTLLEAIKLWMPSADKIHFKIGGTGHLEGHLEKTANNLDISHLITWCGYINRFEAPSFFQKSQVFVLPSQSESFGIVYIEALACGIPVIATKCGGPEEIIHDWNGLLVDIDDPGQLATAMQSIYENYSKYDRTYIREDFEQRYSSREITKKIVAVYDRLIGLNQYKNTI